MNILEVTDEQLRLIQRALDFYSRIGIGQFGVIKEHPTFERYLEKVCRPDKKPEVGDRTPQGEILEIKNGKALINGSVDKKTGHWCDKKEWKKLGDVKLSTDYSRYHEIRDMVDSALVQPRNMLIQDFTLGRNASWGIYNPEVDDSCRVAFDIIQVIRHEYWKKDPNRSGITVDSHIHFSHREDGSSEKIKCKLDVDRPCNFDHNGECLVCDCSMADCAYDRWLKEDYKWESKEQLDEMFNSKQGDNE